MSLFIQIIILIAVLATMIMVLLSIRQLSRFEGFDDAEETSELKEEVEEEDRILSKHNIFHNIVEPEKLQERVKDYRDKDNDPFSRKE